MEDSHLRRRVFSRIFEERFWTHGDTNIPVSGPGSTVENMQPLFEWMEMIFAVLGTKSIADVGCGDQTWMKAFRWRGEYVGIDIVPALIKQLMHEEGYQAHRRFVCADIVEEPLAAKVDLVLCRDVLVHLSVREIRSAITNMKASEAEYLMMTNFLFATNEDISHGGWRPINFSKVPFRFPLPLYAKRNPMHGYDKNKHKELAIWNLQEIEV